MKALCMKVVREDAIETDEDKVFLEDGMATNDGLEVGGTASGHVGVELADALLERADVALNLVADAANNAGEDSIVGVRTEKWNNLLLAYLDEREFFGLVFQRGKPHLDSRSDIASEILIVSVDKVVGDGRACIDYQQVFVGRQGVGSHGCGETVLTQSLGRFVLVLEGNRRVVIEQDEALAEPVECVDDCGVDVDDRGDNAVGDGIERTDLLYLAGVEPFVDEVVDHLAVVGEDSEFGSAVSLVNAEIHSEGFRRKKSTRRMDFYSRNRLITSG